MITRGTPHYCEIPVIIYFIPALPVMCQFSPKQIQVTGTWFLRLQSAQNQLLSSIEAGLEYPLTLCLHVEVELRKHDCPVVAHVS